MEIKFLCEENDDIVSIADNISKSGKVGDISFSYAGQGGKKYRVKKTDDKLEIQAEAAIKIKIPSKVSLEKILSISTFLKRIADINPPSGQIIQDTIYKRLLCAMQDLAEIFADVNQQDKASIYSDDLKSAILGVANGDYEKSKKAINHCCEVLADIGVAKVVKENLDIKEILMERQKQLSELEEACSHLKKNNKKLNKKAVDTIKENYKYITEYDIMYVSEQIGSVVDNEILKENINRTMRGLNV